MRAGKAHDRVGVGQGIGHSLGIGELGPKPSNVLQQDAFPGGLTLNKGDQLGRGRPDEPGDVLEAQRAQVRGGRDEADLMDRTRILRELRIAPRPAERAPARIRDDVPDALRSRGGKGGQTAALKYARVSTSD